MSRLYDNIKFVLKENSIKKGDAEAPYRAGYISRYEQRNAIMHLPLFMVYHIAKTCGVSVEDLIEKDIAVEGELAKVRAEIERLKAMEKELTEGSANETIKRR